MAKQTNESIVKALFEAIGIGRVVYVDDRFGVSRERIRDLCREMSSGQITLADVFPALVLNDDEALREQRLADAIDVLSEAELAAKLDALALAAGKIARPEGEQDRQAATVFSDLLGGAVEAKCLSRAEWKAQEARLASEAIENPTLFVFDEDFRLEGYPSDEGRRLIGSLHLLEHGRSPGYALLTHNAQDDEAEKRIEDEIAKSDPALNGFVIVIAKTRLSGEPQRFVGRLKAALLLRLFRVVRDKLRKATSDAGREALQAIDALRVDAFEEIVFGSSRVEGAWSPDTLLRIFAVLHEKSVRRALRSDREVHVAVDEADPICNVAAGAASEDVAQTAAELQRLEIYDTHDINGLHLPLELGDIFQRQGALERYVLVAQPCDLMLRSDGYRRGRERDQRQVVPLAPILSRVRSESGRSGLADHEFELPHFDEEGGKELTYVGLNNVLYVPAWLLDLAVLNEDGECSIRREKGAPLLLTSSWRKRLDALKERAAHAILNLPAAPSVGDERQSENLKSRLRLPLGTPLAVSLKRDGEKVTDDWTLGIELRRVGHIRERYAVAMLSRFGSYLGRLAYPHDLTTRK